MKEQQWLEDGWFFHNHAWHLLHEIIKLIPDNTESLLDVGAGTGIAAAVIGAVYPDIYVMVSDVEESSKEHWKKRGIDGLISKNEKSPYDDSVFDFVMSSHVVEHVNDPILFVSEMIRVAKKRVVIVVPDGDCHFYDHKTVYDRTNFKKVLEAAIEDQAMGDYSKYRTFPVYHAHINNLVGVIDL